MPSIFSSEGTAQPLRDWGSCSLHRRLHVLVSLHHALTPTRPSLAVAMMSMISSGSERRLAMLLMPLFDYKTGALHPEQEARICVNQPHLLALCQPCTIL